jgi:hypothetical protein
MKKVKAIGVIGCVFILMVMLISGCATVSFDQQAQSIWPAPIQYKVTWYRPELLSSAEEAMGTLRNRQQDFIGFTNGMFGQPFKTFDLDKYGLRTKWDWTETTQSTQYVPSTGGGLVNGVYVSYYGGSYQTSTDSTQHEGSFVIPFAEVSKLWLYHDSYAVPGCVFPWGLMIYLDGGKTVNLRGIDEKTVKQLGNAIATLSKGQGRIVKAMGFGYTGLPLTPEQSAELGLQPGTGFLIYEIYGDSPAEKAGLRSLDVILEQNGKAPSKNPDELLALPENMKSVNLKVLRRENVTDATGNTSLQKKELAIHLNLE